MTHEVSPLFLTESTIDADVAAASATEFLDRRWWTADEIDSADPAQLDPHMHRFSKKLATALFAASTGPTTQA